MPTKEALSVEEKANRERRMDRLLGDMESGTSKLELLASLPTSRDLFLNRHPKVIAQKLRRAADVVEGLAK